MLSLLGVLSFVKKKTDAISYIYKYLTFDTTTVVPLLVDHSSNHSTIIPKGRSMRFTNETTPFGIWKCRIQSRMSLPVAVVITMGLNVKWKSWLALIKRQKTICKLLVALSIAHYICSIFISGIFINAHN